MDICVYDVEKEREGKIYEKVRGICSNKGSGGFVEGRLQGTQKGASRIMGKIDVDKFLCDPE